MSGDLLSLICPQCGANLQCSTTDMTTTCKFCNTQIIVKDFVTERRVDKADKLKSYYALISNARQNNDWVGVYNYYLEVCSLEPTSDNILNMNIAGYCCGKLCFNQAWLAEIDRLDIEAQRTILAQLSNIVQNHKFCELEAYRGKFGNNNKQLIMQINSKYKIILASILARQKALEPVYCSCGGVLQPNDNHCAGCGKSRIDILAEKAKQKAKKRNTLVIICTAVVAVVLAITYISNAIILNNINTAMSNGDYTQAITLIDERIESNSSNVELYLLYADCYTAQNDPKSAIEILEKAKIKVYGTDKDKLQSKIDLIRSEFNLE